MSTQFESPSPTKEQMNSHVVESTESKSKIWTQVCLDLSTTLCLNKTMPNIFSCDCPILIIFGKSITWSLGNKKLVYFPTSPNCVSALPD